MLISCETCKVLVEKKSHKQRFCKPCSSKRRKEKYKEYDKNRPASYIEKKKEIRKSWRERNSREGKCSECKEIALRRQDKM